MHYADRLCQTYRKVKIEPVTVPRHELYVKEEYVKQVIEAMDEE